MFDYDDFGKKLKSYRKGKNLTQEEVAERIGVSGQAVSKWENGECLPDIYNLKLLGRLYRISIDELLDAEDTVIEKVVDTIFDDDGNILYEIVKKPETILAGKIEYARDFPDIQSFYRAVESMDEKWPI